MLLPKTVTHLAGKLDRHAAADGPVRAGLDVRTSFETPLLPCRAAPLNQPRPGFSRPNATPEASVVVRAGIRAPGQTRSADAVAFLAAK